MSEAAVRRGQAQDRRPGAAVPGSTVPRDARLIRLPRRGRVVVVTGCDVPDWFVTEGQRVLPRLIELRTDPPVRGADAAFHRALAAERQRLLLFYQAAANAQSGYPELWARDMKLVLEGDGENPYFRWFGGAPGGSPAPGF